MFPEAVVLVSPQLLPCLTNKPRWDEVDSRPLPQREIVTLKTKRVHFYITVAKNELLYEEALNIASAARAGGARVTLEVNSFGLHNYPMLEAYADEYAESLCRLCEFLKHAYSTDLMLQNSPINDIVIGRITPQHLAG